MPTKEHCDHDWLTLPAAVGQAYQRLAARHAGPTPSTVAMGLGLPSLDRALGPLFPGDVVLVTGRGQAERLAFVTHCASHQPLQRAVAVLCLEHSDERVVQVALASQGRIPLARLDAGGLERDSHWPALADAVEHHHQRPLLLLEPPSVEPDALLEALRALKCAYASLSVVVVDALHRLTPQPVDACHLLAGLAHELGVVLVAGAEPEPALGELDGRGNLVGCSLVAAGTVRAVVQLPSFEGAGAVRSGSALLPVRVFGDHRGTVSSVPLEYDPLCLSWREPSPPVRPAGAAAPVFRREGKELDAVYSAACCALLHEVGLAHYWDGQPSGPGRAWELPYDERVSDEQRLVVRVALDIWDNQGGVLLRDLRKLPSELVVHVGELIADTASGRGPIAWVERHLGEGWQQWMAEGRWQELLGVGWRELMGR